VLGGWVIDGELDAGNIASQLVDLPNSILIPDTSYTYLGAGLHAYAHLGAATIGGGAGIMQLVSSGDVSDPDWYGPGSGSGLVIDASLRIPLPRSLYFVGTVNYTHEHIDFDGSGTVRMAHGVWGLDDEMITGSANVGLVF
jgi:hypothetical protein